MRWVIWGLLFINFSLFGFFQASNYIKQHEEAEPVAAAKPADDGAIKVLSDEDLAAMPRRAPEPVAVASCYEWSNLAPAEATIAQSALQKTNVDFELRTTYALGGDTRYWVYIPSQKTLAGAQAKVEELNALGITESLIVKDPKWRHAISLGLFKNETLANDFMQTLRSKGVKSAIKAKRHSGASEVSLIMKEISPAQAEKLAQVKLSQGTLKTIDCN